MLRVEESIVVEQIHYSLFNSKEVITEQKRVSSTSLRHCQIQHKPTARLQVGKVFLSVPI